MGTYLIDTFMFVAEYAEVGDGCSIMACSAWFSQLPEEDPYCGPVTWLIEVDPAKVAEVIPECCYECELCHVGVVMRNYHVIFSRCACQYETGCDDPETEEPTVCGYLHENDCYAILTCEELPSIEPDPEP